MNNIVTGGMVLVVIWWLVFMMVLPWGNAPIDPDDIGKGHANSAPKKPRILTKVLITTGLTIVLWFGGFWLSQSGLISFRP